MIMTKREALEKCKAHWQYMADTGNSDKRSYFATVNIADADEPECACYCCEYDSQFIMEPDCVNCPLNDYAWDAEHCLDRGDSVFEKWDRNTEPNGSERRAEAAKMMVYACDWALSELDGTGEKS